MEPQPTQEASGPGARRPERETLLLPHGTGLRRLELPFGQLRPLPQQAPSQRNGRA